MKSWQLLEVKMVYARPTKYEVIIKSVYRGTVQINQQTLLPNYCVKKAVVVRKVSMETSNFIS